MRTTVTLDAGTRALLERRMRERGMTFKDALNEAIRAGLGGEAAAADTDYTVPRDLGPASVDLTKALAVAERLEDDAIARRLMERR